jgi:hypothetical protein
MITGTLEIERQKIILTFHYPVLTGPQTGSLGTVCQMCVEQGRQYSV